ncbi:MAG TPA: hypothetical protein VGM37_14805 [Armatimonadota bacterium]|jgi:hypothetical protein
MRYLKSFSIASVVALAICGRALSTPGERIPTIRELFQRSWRPPETFHPFEMRETTTVEWKGKLRVIKTDVVRGNDLTHSAETVTLGGRVFKTWLDGDESVLYEPAAKVYLRRKHADLLGELRRKANDSLRPWLDDESAKKDMAMATITAVKYLGQPAWKATWTDSTEPNPDNPYRLTIIVRRKDGLIQQFRQQARRGHVTVISLATRSIKRMPPSAFQFVAPKGSREGVPSPLSYHEAVPGD